LFFDFLQDVSSISDGRAFASEAGIGRSRYTTYLPEYLKAEYLLLMNEIKENLLGIRCQSLAQSCQEIFRRGVGFTERFTFWDV